jgi:alkaline phosphatase D
MRPVVVSILLVSVQVLSSCNAPQTQAVTRAAPAVPAVVDRIAFGSCNRETLPQPLWSLIGAKQPDVWIWLGDNIYGDSDDMRVMRRKYAVQLRNRSYREFLSRVPVIGTWDDHDYGKNNGGREFRARSASQQALLDFLGEPKASPRRRQEGVYASYTYGPAGKQIKVILLDVRYHRDPIGSNGTMLGAAQWRWLENELRGSTAQIHVIASGIQVIAEDHRFEKWSNFPRERERLFRMIGELRVPGVIFLSGDRHIAELSEIEDGPANYPLYDLTSSGLTHTWSLGAQEERNRHRAGKMVIALNYGIMDVNWHASDPRITLRIHDASDAVRIEKSINLSALQPR